MYVRCTWSEDKLNIYARDNMQYRKREVPNLSMFVLKKKLNRDSHRFTESPSSFGKLAANV